MRLPRRVPPLLLAALALLAAPAAGQRAAPAPTDPAVLELYVRSSADGLPLPGARVRVVGPELDGVADAEGVVVVPGVPPGAYFVRVDALGHARRFAAVEFPAGDTVHAGVQLESEALALDTLRATARRTSRAVRATGFYERMRANSGVFRTRADLERTPLLRVSDAFRGIPGVRTQRMVGGRTLLVSTRTIGMSGECVLPIYVDGVRLPDFDLDHLDPEEVEAIEVYRGPSEAPPEFTSAGGICGAIAIWTRRSV